LERTTHIRDLFSGVLAHDLRSPLGAILNSAELLLHEEQMSPAGVKAVAFVQRGARRMKQIIDAATRDQADDKELDQSGNRKRPL
jgi:light-regulated signal transduction histidine kinase (bacteriophytochrome)